MEPSGQRSENHAELGDANQYDLEAPSLAPTSQTQMKMLEEINGHIFSGVDDLYTKFFTRSSWSSVAEQCVRDMRTKLAVDQDGTLQPGDDLAGWLTRLHESLPGNLSTRCRWSSRTIAQPNDFGQALVLCRSGSGRARTDWTDTLVGGHAQKEHVLYQEGLVALCAYARAVFLSRPARPFLHDFYSRGDQLELWLFDRSGLYGSQTLDMAQAPSQCIAAIIGYMLLSEDELGVSKLVKWDAGGRKYMRAALDGGDEDGLWLGEPTVFERMSASFLGDGLTCFRARRAASESWQYAVKLKWSDPDDDNEFKMLRLAKERGVKGVVRLLHHHVGVRTDVLCHGLSLGPPRRFSVESTSPGPKDTSASALVQAPDGQCRDEVKVFNCTVISLLGRTLHHYNSVPELLYVLRDAVEANRSLYIDGQILHRDINPSNIIIPSSDPDTKSTGGRGVLIDLDMAKENSVPYVPFEAVGTYMFQAIGVLQAYLPENPHTYRHDLESFFYTFLFLAVCPRPPLSEENQLQLPSSSILCQWLVGRPVDKARRKMKDMHALNSGRF